MIQRRLDRAAEARDIRKSPHHLAHRPTWEIQVIDDHQFQISYCTILRIRVRGTLTFHTLVQKRPLVVEQKRISNMALVNHCGTMGPTYCVLANVSAGWRSPKFAYLRQPKQREVGRTISSRFCRGLPLRWRCVGHCPFLALRAMYPGVACGAQRDQVLLCVGSRMTTEFPVVHLKIRHRATGLTPPAVATQDLLAQTFVRQRVQPRASGFGANHSQDAFSRRFSSFVELGCTIEALSVLFSTSQRQSPDSNSLFFDDDNAAFAQRLLHHRHSS